MRVSNFYVLLFVFLLMGIGCKKEKLQPDFQTIKVATGRPFKSIFICDENNWFVAGGIPDNNGYIYQTIDAGNSWQLNYEGESCIYDIEFLNKITALACGEKLNILRTDDGGITWESSVLSWYPTSDYIAPLRDIEFINDTAWFVTGGQNATFGVNVRTINAGSWWDLTVYQVELSTSHFHDPLHGLLGGYGVIYSTDDAAIHVSPVDFNGDNFNSFCFLDSLHGWCCGYNGGIYSTKDGGQSWTSMLKPNGYMGSRIHFRSLAFEGTKGICVGDKGIIFGSEDEGNTWKQLDLGLKTDFYDAVRLENGLFLICDDDGSLITIDL